MSGVAWPAGPTFFGIGAQRAGSSWLYKVLSGYPDCGLPPHKELHFFDIRHGVTKPAMTYAARIRRTAEIAAKIAAVAGKDLQGSPPMFEHGFLAGSEAPALIAKLSRFIEPLRYHDLDGYVRYLDGYRKPADGLAGEITPAYSILPVAGFAEMIGRFADARFIFIMRDPVERSWSQARLTAANGLDAGPAAGGEPGAALLRPTIGMRSDYQATITNLEAVVPRRQIHYAFFEALIDPSQVVEQMRAIEAFLGLAPRSAETLQRFASVPENGAPGGALAPEARRVLLAALGPVYEFVRERFGALPPQWADPRAPEVDRVA